MIPREQTGYILNVLSTILASNT